MYAESGQQTDQRDKAFTYHPPGGTQSERYERLRLTARNLAELLNQSCPPSRELSLAQTKLQEAVMWANAAIACNEVGRVPSVPDNVTFYEGREMLRDKGAC